MAIYLKNQKKTALDQIQRYERSIEKLRKIKPTSKAHKYQIDDAIKVLLESKGTFIKKIQTAKLKKLGKGALIGGGIGAAGYGIHRLAKALGNKKRRK